MGAGHVLLLLVCLMAAVYVLALINWVLAHHSRKPPAQEDDPYTDWRGDDPGVPR